MKALSRPSGSVNLSGARLQRSFLTTLIYWCVLLVKTQLLEWFSVRQMENMKVFPKALTMKHRNPIGPLHAAGLCVLQCFQESNRTIEHARLLSKRRYKEESEDKGCLSVWWEVYLGLLCWPCSLRPFSREVMIDVSTFHSDPSKVTTFTQSLLAHSLADSPLLILLLSTCCYHKVMLIRAT